MRELNGKASDSLDRVKKGRIIRKAFTLLVALALVVALIPIASMGVQEDTSIQPFGTGSEALDEGTGEPSGGDPFGGDPFGGDPFAGDPSGGDPFGGDPAAEGSGYDGLEPQDPEGANPESFGIEALSIPYTPVGSSVQVTDWATFKAAWDNNAGVSEIVLMNDIVRTDTAAANDLANAAATARVNDLRVISDTGKHCLIDLGPRANTANAFTLGNRTAASPAWLIFENVNITGGGTNNTYMIYNAATNAPANSAGWTIALTNVVNANAGRPLIDVAGALVVLDETVTWHGSRNVAQIIATNLSLTDGAVASLSKTGGNNLITLLGWTATGENSQLSLSGTGGVALVSPTAADFGIGSKLTITGTVSGIVATGGSIRFGAGSTANIKVTTGYGLDTGGNVTFGVASTATIAKTTGGNQAIHAANLNLEKDAAVEVSRTDGSDLITLTGKTDIGESASLSLTSVGGTALTTPAGMQTGVDSSLSITGALNGVVSVGAATSNVLFGKGSKVYIKITTGVAVRSHLNAAIAFDDGCDLKITANDTSNSEPMGLVTATAGYNLAACQGTVRFGEDCTVDIFVSRWAVGSANLIIGARTVASFVGNSTSNAGSATSLYDTIALIPNTNGYKAYLIVNAGADVTVRADLGNAITMIGWANSGDANTSLTQIQVLDGATLDVEGFGTGGGDYNGIIDMISGGGGTDVLNGSTLNVRSMRATAGMPVVLQQVRGGNLNVTGGSKLNIYQYSTYSEYTAA
ncbi:MAG: hypothetical protein LBP91_00340, partial [Coriobacteriales bacterium]|nr:hypothetical protein [Coriobacteriales bacterium]